MKKGCGLYYVKCEPFILNSSMNGKSLFELRRITSDGDRQSKKNKVLKQFHHLEAAVLYDEKLDPCLSRIISAMTSSRLQLSKTPLGESKSYLKAF